MRNSSCRRSAIRDWRCMRRAPCPLGCGRPTARGSCGPIRSAHGVRRRQRRRPRRAKSSARPIRIGGRSRGSRAACRRMALSGWSGCAVLAQPPAGLRPAAVRGSISPMAATAFWSPPAMLAGRTMPLVERLQRLVDGIELPIAAFARDGMLIGASDAARPLLGFRNLAEAGLDEARDDALKQGRVETPFGIGHMVLQRVGSGADIGLIALSVPEAAQDREQPTPLREAPAELTLFDRICRATRDAQRNRNPPIADEPIEPMICRRVLQPSLRACRRRTGAARRNQKHCRPAPEAEIDRTSHRPMLDAPLPMNRCAARPPMPRHVRRAIAACAAASAALHVADGPRRPLLARRRRIRPPDRPAHRGWFRPARGARSPRRSARSRWPRDARRSPRATTWSGITLNWPVDGGGRLPVELSGLPIFDRARNFAGYRGFGVCRDLDGLARLAPCAAMNFSMNRAAAQTAVG